MSGLTLSGSPFGNFPSEKPTREKTPMENLSATKPSSSPARKPSKNIRRKSQRRYEHLERLPKRRSCEISIPSYEAGPTTTVPWSVKEASQSVMPFSTTNFDDGPNADIRTRTWHG